MPKKPKTSRRMYATKDFFAKPGVVEKLLRDEGMQYYHTVPVVVIRLDAIEAIRNAAHRAVGESAGSHSNTIDLTLWAAGLLAERPKEF